ncbi:hypothetical protein Bca4012_077864 [Brassica carinata]
MEVPINVTYMGQREVMVNPQSKSFFVGVCLWFDFTHNEPSISVKALFVLCDARFPKFQLANGINIQSQSVTLRFDERFDERIWDPDARNSDVLFSHVDKIRPDRTSIRNDSNSTIT